MQNTEKLQNEPEVKSEISKKLEPKPIEKTNKSAKWKSHLERKSENKESTFAEKVTQSKADIQQSNGISAA